MKTTLTIAFCLCFGLASIAQSQDAPGATGKAPCTDCTPLCIKVKGLVPSIAESICKTSNRIRRRCTLSCGLCDVEPTCRDCERNACLSRYIFPDTFKSLCQTSDIIKRSCQSSCGICTN